MVSGINRKCWTSYIFQDRGRLSQIQQGSNSLDLNKVTRHLSLVFKRSVWGKVLDCFQRGLADTVDALDYSVYVVIYIAAQFGESIHCV